MVVDCLTVPPQLEGAGMSGSQVMLSLQTFRVGHELCQV